MNRPGLIETMLRTADGTVPRLQRHMDRLSQSAEVLEINCDIGAIRTAIDAVAGRGSPMRLRLELSADGHWQLDSAAFAEDPPDRIWRLRIAKTTLNSTDLLLRHKTTFRHRYEAARREFTPEAADEVLLCNERGEVCEGTITSLFLRRHGERILLTPALGCGLLRGVLRQHLLDSGAAREAILKPGDLKAADELHIGNALRGLLPARLA